MRFSESERKPMLSGRQTCTPNIDQLGDQGDTFEAFGESWVIGAVLALKLKVVRDDYYDQSGFLSPRDFERAWAKSHYKNFDDDSEVWVHWFGRA